MFALHFFVRFSDSNINYSKLQFAVINQLIFSSRYQVQPGYVLKQFWVSEVLFVDAESEILAVIRRRQAADPPSVFHADTDGSLVPILSGRHFAGFLFLNPEASYE